MDTLVNLPELKQDLSKKIALADLSDIVLPAEFKSNFVSFGESYRIEEYYQYTIRVSSKKSECIIPNQWVFIAAICSQYCNELKKYKTKLVGLGVKDEDFEACHPSSNDGKKNKPDAKALKKKATSLLKSYEGDDKEWLISFLWDYDSWGGGKNIKRSNDFTASPCLDIANSINASSTLIADIAKTIGDSPQLFNAIMSSDEMKRFLKGTDKSEILRKRPAAAFLKEALLFTLTKDPGLKRLERIEKYSVTSKNLKIDGFVLGRNKNQPGRASNVFPQVTWDYNNISYVLNLEFSKGSMEKQFFPAFNEAYKNWLRMEKDSNEEYVLYELALKPCPVNSLSPDMPLQQLYYGAPGTGKSFYVEENVIKGLPHYRVTFHPDTDYSSFVGCYKPETIDDGMVGGVEKSHIGYGFHRQVFLEAYVDAWQHLSEGKKVYLVIEEINRGNCAQIFGDIFQLLDRRKDGFSKYTINADKDIERVLNDIPDYKDRFLEAYPNKTSDWSGNLMALPCNLYIIATMNTSDQSLFPMDSAFKRRWDCKFFPIDYTDANKAKLALSASEKYPWGTVLQILNDYIKKETESANKTIGNRFIDFERTENEIDYTSFRDKVLFFLFSDVFKDSIDFAKFFFGDKYENPYMFFEDLCEIDGTDIVRQFIKKLDTKSILKINDPVQNQDEASTPEDSE